jgi:hypothetical protein
MAAFSRAESKLFEYSVLTCKCLADTGTAGDCDDPETAKLRTWMAAQAVTDECRSSCNQMYRRKRGDLEVFLVHPGGPYWAKKDEGSWSIPKGEYEGGEQALDAVCREFTQETSFVPQGPFVELGMIRQKSGKVVTAWAFEGSADADQLVSNTCQIE